MIFSQLVRVLRADGQDIAGIYERNDVALRDKEGMAQGKGWYPLAGEPLPDFTRDGHCGKRHPLHRGL